MTRHPTRVFVRRSLFAFFVFSGLIAIHATAAGITLPQANGGALNLPAPVKRIVTLAPNLAELVFAAGAGNQLKAVVEYSNYPEPARQIPRVGDAFRINLEQIIELEPDLVIAWATGNPQTALKKLEQLDITVWQVEITQPQEIADTVENISRAAGTHTTGQPVAQKMRNKLADLRRNNTHKTRVDYFYQVAARPLYTINKRHIISRGLEICGGHNVFSDLPSLAPQVSLESVLLANPQVMIAPENPGDPPALDVWQDWPRLRAVQNKNLLYLPADGISQATPRLLDSIDLACKLLDEVRKKTKQAEEK